MREACIICPQHDSAGHSLQHVKHYAEKALCNAFGGCTTLSAKGSWVDPRGELITEPVWQIIAAYEPNVTDDHKLASVARYIGHEGKQQAVYVRYADGNVEIIPTTLEETKHAA